MARGAKKEVAPHVGIPQGDHVEEYLVKPLFDADGVQSTSGIGKDGREYPDPVPMSPPVGYTPPPDIMTLIHSMIRNEQFLKELAKEDLETEEEANDFDIEDDPVDPLTPYEKVFLPAAPVTPPPAAPAAGLSNMPVASPVPQSVPALSGGNSGTVQSVQVSSQPVAQSQPIGSDNVSRGS